MSGLTTHILDLTHGKPAANVKVDLYVVTEASGILEYRKSVVTNDDGRLDTPLLVEDEMKVGEYELVFYVGEYFRAKEMELTEPHFLERVPVRFCISDVEAHYHVPLLVSPWGYQVYRGS
ncbi:hydroxyisourate hydrolase [Litchfieldia salsa]|uniref:5-hydroxyisourate hydrolase n=1 Tax=Litchfieldia salsa TaxID=930152 RepID=A0A1H0U8X2_9BACI|nr:hydroxyisourate hydrolase [Litchfieldia salsa]SDP62727.1 5-hydroxyisourate hydrolase [Litchfieldia salsa]